VGLDMDVARFKKLPLLGILRGIEAALRGCHWMGKP